MRDIGREIGLAGKDILNLSNHMIERDNQLLQLNGNACRFQPRIKILGGDVFNGIADITKGQVPLTDSDANDQNNQQAYHDGDRNQIFFQRIEVMEMEINGEASQHDIILLFALKYRLARGGDNPVCFHLHFRPGIHRSRRILHRPEKDIPCAAVLAKICGIHGRV